MVISRCDLCGTKINESYNFDKMKICIECLAKEVDKMKEKKELKKDKKNEITSNQDNV